jgi:hypothetical protein
MDPVRQFVDNGLGAIETEQWLNLVLQETESRYLLSLPFLFPGGVRVQDLVIRFDGGGRGAEEGERSFQVTLYLDLDVLGRAVADVTMKADQVGCAIRFEEKSGCDLLAPIWRNWQNGCRRRDTGSGSSPAWPTRWPGRTEKRS